MRAQLADYQKQTVHLRNNSKKSKKMQIVLAKTISPQVKYNSAKQKVHDYELELDRLRKMKHI